MNRTSEKCETPLSTIKCTNIHIVEVPEGEEKKIQKKTHDKIMTENSKLDENINLHTKKVNKLLSRKNMKRSTARYC